MKKWVPRYLLTILAALLAVYGSPSLADQEGGNRSLPEFSDYPADVYQGARPPLRLTEAELYFANTYRDAYQRDPNFAGHYVLQNAPYGCCIEHPGRPPQLMTLVGVDLQSGAAISLEFEGVSDPEDGRDLDCPVNFRDSQGQPVTFRHDFKLDSRLLVVSGMLSENRCQIAYYEMRSGRLQLLRQIFVSATQ